MDGIDELGSFCFSQGAPFSPGGNVFACPCFCVAVVVGVGVAVVAGAVAGAAALPKSQRWRRVWQEKGYEDEPDH